MKQFPRWSRTSHGILESLHERINLYAMAASAAGVSLLVLSQPAEAEVVFTQAHAVLNAGDIFRLDLNADANVDFKIKDRNHGKEKWMHL